MSGGEKPRLGELLLSTEGLALLRLAFTGDDATRSARVSEMRSLLERLDEPELAASLAASEYDLAQGYDLWSKTYDAPLRLFFIEQLPMHALFATLPTGTVLDAPAAPDGTACTSPRRAIGPSPSTVPRRC